MGSISIFLTGLSFWVYIVAGVIVLGIIIFFVSLVMLNRLRIEKAIKLLEQSHTHPLEEISKRTLLRSSRYIIRMARKKDTELVQKLGLPEIWIDQLKNNGRKKDLKRVLSFAPDEGLFYCMKLVLKKKRYSSIFLGWLDNHGDLLVLRRVALSGKGEDFNGNEALSLFEDRLDEIREMTGDPEWAARYFAVKILIHHKAGQTSNRSQNSVKELFLDSYPLIRETICREFEPVERKHFSAFLLDRYIKDPVYEVRYSAKKRLLEDFSEFYQLDFKNHLDVEILHILESLYTTSKEDENISIQFLPSNNMELRFHAAYFLNSVGTLKKLFTGLDQGDSDLLDRSHQLLECACSVGVNSFLSEICCSEKEEVLKVGALLLEKYPDRRYINSLAERAFSIGDSLQDKNIYLVTVNTISSHGNEKSYILLNQEILKQRDNKEKLAILLPRLPQRGDYIFRNVLLDFLKRPDFPHFRLLREALIQLPFSMVLPELIKIIKSPIDTYHRRVRIEALKTLGAMNLVYTIQFILENIHILSVDDARDFSKILNEFKAKDYEEKVLNLLDGDDAKIRSSLISCISVTGNKNFLPQIRKGVEDADPDVRVASIWALVDYGDTRSLNQGISGLRDPVDRVRVATAKALGKHGSDNTFKELKKVLADKNEIGLVKSAVIYGLGESENIQSLEILVDTLPEEEELADEITDVLSKKRGKKELVALMEHLKDASPDLRDQLIAVFTKMGQRGRLAAIDLLEDDIPSLKPLISEILEKTGAVESAIRNLSNRNPEIRCGAAEFLSKVGTVQAFRGIVLAARDPNRDVRIRVVKALERLNTQSGKGILTELQEDPDKRVRKYTEWAMERIKSKSL